MILAGSPVGKVGFANTQGVFAFPCRAREFLKRAPAHRKSFAIRRIMYGKTELALAVRLRNSDNGLFLIVLPHGFAFPEIRLRDVFGSRRRDTESLCKISDNRRNRLGDILFASRCPSEIINARRNAHEAENKE